jgi:serine/threonine-protein kinase
VVRSAETGVPGRATPAIGSDIGAYRVEALLGRGGMGVVYRATDSRLGRSVALKVLPPQYGEDRTFRARFLRESRVAASIDHPGVIPIYEAGDDGGQLYIAMRYVDGTDLAALLSGGGPLDPERALALTGQLAAALDAAPLAEGDTPTVKDKADVTARDDVVRILSFFIHRQ